MLLYPKVQEKVRAELDRVVGRDRLPSSTDKSVIMINYVSYLKHKLTMLTTMLKNRLPYTTAVLAELERVASIAPLTVPHRSLKDCKLHGYDIPKNTFIFVVLASVHLDPAYWGEDAEEFRPERFLDENNELNKLIKSDHLMGFGLGMCNYL